VQKREAATSFTTAQAQAVSANDLSLAGSLNQHAMYWWAEVLKTNPTDSVAEINLALRMVESDNQMQGILRLRDIVTRNPNHYDANVYLGQFSVRTNQTEKAVQRFRQAITANPNRPEAYYHLGTLLAADPSTRPEAKELLKKAMELSADENFQRMVQNQLRNL
jgi:cytochrome c-type biogenesis protein CcmH/NrfG